MAKTKTTFFIISCSADGGDVDLRFLCMHGEGAVGFLPTTIKEAKKRVQECYGILYCDICDAEIHRCSIVRQKQTAKQGFIKNENKLDLRKTNYIEVAISRISS